MTAAGDGRRGDDARAGVEERVPLDGAADVGAVVDGAKEDCRHVRCRGDRLRRHHPLRRLHLRDDRQRGRRRRQRVGRGADRLRAAALRQHQRIGTDAGVADRLEVAQPERGGRIVDPQTHLRADRRAIGEERNGRRARLVLCRKRDAILQVDADGIGAGGKRLRVAVGPNRRHEQQAAADAERRRHVGTGRVSRGRRNGRLR